MKLIFLNGPSSAGKTSLARRLQEILPDYYLYFGIDAFIDMMPAHANNLGGTEACDGFYWRDTTLPDGSRGREIASGDYGRRIEQGFRTAIRALLDDGHHLVVDNVIDGRGEFDTWKQLLGRHDCCFVGIHCALEELQRRESERPDRMPGSAAEQYFRTHDGIDYDVTVDTGRDSIDVAAAQILEAVGERGGAARA